MSETRELLGKIAALRQRLEQAQRLATEAGSAAAELLREGVDAVPRLRLVESQVAVGAEYDAALDCAVRPLTGPPAGEVLPLPRKLTMRARRVLERGRDLLGRLRAMGDAFSPPPDKPDLLPLFDRAEPLSCLYRETAAMTNTSLRLVPLFPETTAAQLHLCEGLESILAVVAGRVKTLAAGVEARRSETERIAQLGDLLTALESGAAVDLQAWRGLAEEVVADALAGGPLRFVEGDPERPAHFVACHSLTTARVMARTARHDPEWRSRLGDAVLAALVHDAGMLRVHATLLTHPGPLDGEQRREIESHCRVGADLAARLLPDADWLAKATREHHERLDGTGYPDGLRAGQLTSLSRLLAVCDVYAAFCVPRAYRPAKGTRTGMADTLLFADQGLLDRDHAERLMHLSFYPVGAAVELADGAQGVVASTPPPRRDLNNPARPVVVLLTDGLGEALPTPRPLDLAQCDDRSIVRSLSPAERRELLGGRFPEWV